MIAELAFIAAVAVAGQDLIHADISGSRRWSVAVERSGGIVAFLPVASEGDTREVVLITTARVFDSAGEPPVPVQAFFEHRIDCRAWTQVQTGFGMTDPAPLRWTPMDGPPPSRPVHSPRPIEPNTAIAIIAETVCRDADLNLRQVEGDWSAVSRALRQQFGALSAPPSAASAQ